MKKLLKAVVAFVCALGFTSAHAQLTTITASSISMGGTPIATGTVTFTPVNSYGTAIAFASGGGGLNSPKAFSCVITAGAITGGCQIPDAALTTPANLLYSIQIMDTGNHQVFTLQQVANVTGTTWPLDHYGPPSPTTNVQTVQSAYGTAAPPASCVTPSQYTQNVGGGKFFTCVGGVFVQMAAVGFLGTPGTVNASDGSNSGKLTDIISTAPTRVNLFGDSKCHGDFTGGWQQAFCGVWASKFEQQATVNPQAISGQSAADVAKQVYATTFATGDKSLIATATNDNFSIGAGDDQYYHSLLDIAAYAAIPDGSAASGYPAKTSGTAITWASGTCTTGTYYAITATCPTGSVSNPIGFVGDHFYLSVDLNQVATFSISVAFDGGQPFVYGPMGYTGCSHPYCFSALSHLNLYTYAPYLLRVPMLTGGRNTYHTAVITVTGTGPAPINWVGSNGAAVLYSGPQVVIPNLEQEGGDTLGTKANVADLTTNAVVGELAEDGFNVVKADVSGVINYSAGPNVTVTGTTVAGSSIITTTSVTGTVKVGMGLSGNGWAAATQVIAVGSGTITMATNASATNSSPVSFIGNANWANTLHEDIAGAQIKAEAIGRATSPLANGKLPSYALVGDNYFTTSTTVSGYNALTSPAGYVAYWNLPFPAQLVSVSVSNQGTQASCTTVTSTSYVTINSSTNGFPLYAEAFFAAQNTYIPASAMTFLDGGPVDDLVGGDLLFVSLHGYVGTGCTAGNTTTAITALWKRL